MKEKTLKRRSWSKLLLPLFFLNFILYACTSEKDLDKELLQDNFQAKTQARVFGNYQGSRPNYTETSIYDALKAEKNFTITVRLLDDLQLSNLVSSSSLVNSDDQIREIVDLTIFVANDEAFTRFFSNNKWGVQRYEDLSIQQKKTLCYSTILRGAFQKHMLPKIIYSQMYDEEINMRYPSYTLLGKGRILKQKTELTELEGILDFKSLSDVNAFIPNNSNWNILRNQNQLQIAMDVNRPYLIQFLPETLEQNGISNEDIKFITNRNDVLESDFLIFDCKVIDYDIPCKNGFIHELDRVIVPPSNMANEARTNRGNSQHNTTIFSNLMDKFSYPIISNHLTNAYNIQYNNNVQVYQKKYLSIQNRINYDGVSQRYVLSFDPSSNGSTTSNNTNREIESNMNTIFAPSDDAFNQYATHEGRVLMETYGSWDNVPQGIIAALLNNHFVSSFTVPSKFNLLQNSSNQPLEITSSNVVKKILSNNGVVYITDKLLIPESFSSVLFPTLVRTNMNILNWVINQTYSNIILNSKQQVYSFVIPTDEALLNYVDPVSYGSPTRRLLKFYFNANATDVRSQVWASIWSCDDAGTAIDSISMASYDVIMNRLRDVLNNHILVGDVRECKNGITHFQTLAGSTVKVTSNGNGGYNFYNNSTLVTNSAVSVTENNVYSLSNGQSFASSKLVGNPLLSAFKSMEKLAGTETDKGPFYEFFHLLRASGVLTSLATNHSTADEYLSPLKAFNYTIFIPTNIAMMQAYAKGLPSWKNIDLETDEAKQTAMRSLIKRFICYHIQNNSVYIGQTQKTANYNTTAINRAKTGFLKVTTSNSANGITVTDTKNNERHVLQQNFGIYPLYNIMSRDYLFDTNNPMTARAIYSAANSAIHQIDGYLDGGFTNNAGEFVLEF